MLSVAYCRCLVRAFTVPLHWKPPSVVLLQMALLRNGVRRESSCRQLEAPLLSVACCCGSDGNAMAFRWLSNSFLMAEEDFSWQPTRATQVYRHVQAAVKHRYTCFSGCFTVPCAAERSFTELLQWFGTRPMPGLLSVAYFCCLLLPVVACCCLARALAVPLQRRPLLGSANKKWQSAGCKWLAIRKQTHLPSRVYWCKLAIALLLETTLCC